MGRFEPMLTWMGLCLAALGISGIVHAKPSGSIVGWGTQVLVEQSALEGCVAIATGGNHSLSVKSDGTIAAWGPNDSGQCNVPAPNSGFVAGPRSSTSGPEWPRKGSSAAAARHVSIRLK